MERVLVVLKTVAMLAISLGLAGCLGNTHVEETLGGFGGCGTNCPSNPEFLYASSPDHISAFTINPATGALGAPLTMPGPNQSTGMTAITLGYLYISDFPNETVEGFSVNSNTGGLTAIQGSPFPLSGTAPGAGGLSASVSGGTYLYATDLNAGKVDGFAFDFASGKLTAVPGSPFSVGNTPVQAVQAGLQGKFLYVSNVNDSAGGISAFTIDFNTGSLTAIPGSPFATGASGTFPGPSALVTTDSFLYVALAGTANANNRIAGFSIDQSSGSLTPIAGSPFVTGSDPLYMALLPLTNKFLFTANIQDNTISVFAVDGTSGLLAPVSGSPFPAGTSVGGLAINPVATSTGNYFLYAANPQGNAISGYIIDGNTGNLSAISGSPFAAGNSPALLAIAVP